MCGIVGYFGKRKENIGKILLDSIKKLEYRGYDSVGMAIKSKDDIIERKDIGKICQVDEKLKFSELKGDFGIAHTRWATNGAVTVENSHPHHDYKNKIYLVHNGIIENYQEIKTSLTREGVVFNSETDSEVLAQLIGNYYEKGLSFYESVIKSLKKIKGSYALIIINKESDEMILAKKDSPLIIAINNNENMNEYFIASDVSAVLGYSKEIIYFEDNEVAVLNKNKIKFYNIEKELEIEKEISKIDWNLEQAQKGEFEHFMLKEIYEQKETIQRSTNHEKQEFNKIVEILKDSFGLFFVGCGTSYHAALSASYIFSHVAKKHVNVVLASEFRNYEEFLTDKTVVVAISQSGETADLLDAIKTAKRKNSKIISIVNVMGSTLMRLSDKTIMMNSGPEICVLSTKSYTSQLSILIQIAYSMINKHDFAKEIILKNIEEGMKNLTDQTLNIKKISEKIKDTNSMFLIGRDLAFPSALEGALKIKEVSYIHAEGFAGGELKHGTIALIEKGTPCLVLVTNETREMILSNASEIKSRGGYIIGLDSENNEIFDDWIKVNDGKMSSSISLILPIQLLAYNLALLRGCDPDKPRNLAKSVTVK